MFKTAIVAIATIVASFVLAGCNTIEGMGKDIAKAGDKIEQAAKKSK